MEICLLLKDAGIAGKYLKPYQGLKRSFMAVKDRQSLAGKYLFPHLGLETPKLLETCDRIKTKWNHWTDDLA